MCKREFAVIFSLIITAVYHMLEQINKPLINVAYFRTWLDR